MKNISTKLQEAFANWKAVESQQPKMVGIGGALVTPGYAAWHKKARKAWANVVALAAAAGVHTSDLR